MQFFPRRAAPPTSCLRNPGQHFRFATLAASLCLILAANAGGVANAAEMQSDTVSVSVKGLDLTSQAGMQAARHRIFVAARKACDQPESPELHARLDYDRCQQDAIADAMPLLQARAAAARAQGQFAAR